MKYLITVVLTGLVVGLAVVAYFKGWIPSLPSNKPQAASVQTTEVSSPTQNPVPDISVESALPSPSLSPSPVTAKVQAGGILVFKKYSLSLPNGWASSTEGSVPGQIDKLNLGSGLYSIVFTQAAMGGGGCVYPGDPDQQMSVKFNGFNAVTTSTGEKLRVGVLPSGNRAVCEMQNGSWGDLTEFGHIDITNPPTPDQAVLDQINSILSSIKKL